MTVDYIPFATGGGASVMSQPDFVTNAPTGVVPGLADPTFANKSWRQSSMVAAAVANFISSTLGISVLDDGNLTTLVNNLTIALEVAASNGLALGMNAPTNLQVAASLGSNNLTIGLKGTNGVDPSLTNPVTIPFRDPTAVFGEVVARQVTAATFITITSGNTMGVAANNQPFRLWVVAFDNAGTVAIGAILASTSNQIFPLSESGPQSSQAGTNGGSTAGLYYANVGSISSKSIRILGYIEFGNGLANIGVWATAFTKIQLFGPGQRKPGDIVQAMACVTSTSKIGTPNATKIDLSGWSPAPTPTLTATPNLVRLRLTGNMTSGAVSGNVGYVQLFRGTNATVLGNASTSGQGTGGTLVSVPVICEAFDLPQTLTPTYGAFVISSTGTAASWLPAGLPAVGTLMIEEIMG